MRGEVSGRSPGVTTSSSSSRWSFVFGPTFFRTHAARTTTADRSREDRERTARTRVARGGAIFARLERARADATRVVIAADILAT
eukprot:31562-Pelagococcus_subviridis.AAC.12